MIILNHPFFVNQDFYLRLVKPVKEKSTNTGIRTCAIRKKHIIKINLRFN